VEMFRIGIQGGKKYEVQELRGGKGEH